ncbi:MAG: NTP transferase domain-containing protein [candidate division Zixibacteria bacterium]|nr:NTP transferase domain-containing protein [candidate division Zixibacteria bacterium]
MRAIIPAAGIGSRLRPHTHTAPKALIHVAGKPILGHIIDELLAHDLREIVFIVGFLGEMIVDYVNTRYPNIKAYFVEQKELNGLGWAIYLAREYIEKEPILIILGDTIFDADLEQVIKSDYDYLGTKIVDDPRRFGIAETDGCFITKLVEKPDSPVSSRALVGIYYLKSTLLFRECLEELINKNIKTRDEYQLTDALGLMIGRGCKMKTFTVDGWYDCGKKETLLETNRFLLSQIKTSRQYNNVIIIPPVYIADSATIKNSVIGPYVSVADSAIVENSVIRDSIISSGADVKDCLLEASLIGNHSSVIGTYNRLNLGDSSEISLY